MSILPHKIGRYDVVGRLAVGGMAEILLGRLKGARGFERPVVIKRILPHLMMQPSFVDMFLDEARIVSRIRHPNVVQVHELDGDGDELFLVMEFLEGESAGGVMRRLVAQRSPPLSAELVGFVIAEACAGLHAAHELTDEDGYSQYLVHRDVSPQNVFVSYDGTVKLIDFGIAKAADRITRTEAGQVKGKLQYMSPEHVRGESIDRRSDLFALGVVMHELSTAHALFKRETDFDTFHAVCDDPIPPIRDLVPAFPAALDKVCLRALARDREDRYPTALDMRRDLLRALRDIDAGETPEQDLASLMRTIFSERIEEKREMLRVVADGQAPAALPEAETDIEVDVPPIEPTIRQAPLKPAAWPATEAAVQRSPSRRWLAMLALGGAAAAGVVGWSVRGSVSPEPAEAATAMPAITIDPAAVPSLAPPAASAARSSETDALPAVPQYKAPRRQKPKPAPKKRGFGKFKH